MPIPIEVFSLSDVMGKADQARAMRQKEQMNQMKMQEYMRAQDEQRTLGDIMARSITTTGGSPAVAAQPEQVMPEGVLGPPRQEVSAVPAVPGRTDFDYNKMFEQVPNLPEAMRGPVLQKLHAARSAEEDRRLAIQMKMMAAKGGGLEGYVWGKDAQGKLQRLGINKQGQAVPIAPPEGYEYDPGQTYLQITNPVTGSPEYAPAPRAGGMPTGRPMLTAEAGKNVEQVGKMYKDMNVSEIDTFVANLYPKIMEAKKTGQLEGVGYLKNTNLSNLVKSPKGEEIYRDAMGFASAILRASAGLSQTTQEAARVMTKMAFDTTARSDSFVKQFEKLVDAYERDRANIPASFGRTAVDMWMRNNPSGVDLITPPWKKGTTQTSIPGAANPNNQSTGGQSILDKYGVK